MDCLYIHDAKISVVLQYQTEPPQNKNVFPGISERRFLFSQKCSDNLFFFNKLYISGNMNFFSHQYTAGFQSSIPVQTKIFSVEFSADTESGTDMSLGLGSHSAVFSLKNNILGTSHSRNLAVDDNSIVVFSGNGSTFTSDRCKFLGVEKISTL